MSYLALNRVIIVGFQTHGALVAINARQLQSIMRVGIALMTNDFIRLPQFFYSHSVRCDRD